MSFEIERKFLVRGNEWEKLATRRTSLRQAYLACNGKASIRIRIKDHGAATHTVKSRPADLRRLELEYDIPVLEAEALMKLRQGATSFLAAISPGKSMCSRATTTAWSLPKSSCGTSISTSNCRPGLARRSPGSRSTTTAPWCSVHFAHGRARRRRCRSTSGREWRE